MIAKFIFVATKEMLKSKIEIGGGGLQKNILYIDERKLVFCVYKSLLKRRGTQIMYRADWILSAFQINLLSPKFF